jgi:hypothetical protein
MASRHVSVRAWATDRSQQTRLASYCLRISLPRGLCNITAPAALTAARTTTNLKILTLTIVLILFRS